MPRADKSVVIALLCTLVVVLVQCNNRGDKSTVTVTSNFSTADVAKGQQLAASYCQSCHQLPDPALLDKKTWRTHVLPVMGLYLGIQTSAFNKINSPTGDQNYMTHTPAIDSVQWSQIAAYYITKAPEHLPVAQRPEPLHQLPFFSIQPAPADLVTMQPVASCVKIDETVTPHRLIVADGLTNKLSVVNDKRQTLSSVTLDGPVVDVLFQNHQITATIIGQDLFANNLKNGFIKQISIDKSGSIKPATDPIFFRLSRPLSVQIADFNQDGKGDYLIAQFGKMAGRLSWVEKSGHEVNEHLLRDKPGCIKTIIEYNTKSKAPDIWALFAQGDEGVFLYANDGKGNFEEKKVLSFPPSYGSSYFDLVDFNGDGFKDIIYTCGDNGDYSQILKPYHGVYIYLNDGTNNFAQKYFYPIHGCYKAIVRDFDGDGDLDIATISQFPAEKTNWESFIYLQNKGKLDFQAYTLPLNNSFKHVITIDAGDIDGDGKLDLLLGNGTGGADKNKQPIFMVLKNITSTKK